MILYFALGDLEIIDYFDADSLRDTNDGKSTTEYIFLFGGTIVLS